MALPSRFDSISSESCLHRKVRVLHFPSVFCPAPRLKAVTMMRRVWLQNAAYVVDAPRDRVAQEMTAS